MTPGYRIPTAEDIAEAKSLLAEAGYPDGAGLNVSFLQRGNQPSATVAAIQDMIRKNLNVEMEIELTDEGGYYDRVLNKDFDTTGTFTAAEIIDPGPCSLDSWPMAAAGTTAAGPTREPTN